MQTLPPTPHRYLTARELNEPFEASQINKEALDKAVRRFPWLLKRLRESPSIDDSPLIKEYASAIVREYRLILTKEVG